MKKFSELGIKVKHEHFDGDKIKIHRILDKKIIVLNAKIEKSQYKGDCLKLHFEFEGERRITFTSARKLLEAMEQATKDSFPFETKIIEIEKSYKFTDCD